jgi:hypothetical protein
VHNAVTLSRQTIKQAAPRAEWLLLGETARQLTSLAYLRRLMHVRLIIWKAGAPWNM